MRVALVSRNARLYSSRRIIQAIRDLGHDAVIVDPFRCVLSLNPVAIRHRFRPLKPVDVVIPRVGNAGASVVLAVSRQLQLLGAWILNPTEAILLARDKLATLQRLQMAGIPVPSTQFSVDQLQLPQTVRSLGSPLILKTLDGLQGAGVIISETPRSVVSMMDHFHSSRTDFIAQEFIHEANNADVRVLVLGSEVVGAMCRQGQDGEFRSNIHRGGVGESVALSDAEIAMSLAAAQTLGLRFAGVDILRAGSGSMVIEVNASPGLEGIETVLDADLARKVVEVAISGALR